jgi:hypothetical protein
MTLTHTSEKDFSETKYWYPDFQVHVADKIAKKFSAYPFLTQEGGNKLVVIVSDPDTHHSRVEQEIGHGKFKITIEPLI